MKKRVQCGKSGTVIANEAHLCVLQPPSGGRARHRQAVVPLRGRMT